MTVSALVNHNAKLTMHETSFSKLGLIVIRKRFTTFKSTVFFAKIHFVHV